MASPTAERPVADRPNDLGKLLIAILVVPAPFEIINAFAKKETYDFRRLEIVLGGLAVLALIVAVIGRRRYAAQSVLGYYLMAIGAGMTAFGVVVTFHPAALLQATLSPAVETTLSALTPSAGLLMVVGGIYLVRDQHRRVRDEFEHPSPPTIAQPRSIRAGDRAYWLWRSPHLHNSPATDGLVDICKSQLSRMDLHYVALYDRDGACLFYVDVLDDDALDHFDIRDTPGRRRDYEQTGRHLRHVADRLSRRLSGLNSGRIVRLVVDIEKGALYLYNLRTDGFLIGVTLDQTEVDPTDRKLSALANEILVYRGGRPDDDFYRK
jgi:hypothetical protein